MHRSQFRDERQPKDTYLPEQHETESRNNTLRLVIYAAVILTKIHSYTCLLLFLSFFSSHQAPPASCVNVWELEQPIGHRWGAHGRPGQARQHCGEVVAPVEAVFEFRQI